MSEFDCDIHQEDKDEIWMCLSCYDSGVAREERERIIRIFENEQYRFGKAFVDEIIQIIKGEKK